MNFKDTTIKGLFDNSIQYSIPVYQRAYSWKIDNWTVFISDLFEQMGRDNEYSYGNLLLETIKRETSYEVIDGQQRLTTLIIFMRSLYSALKAKNVDEETLKEITEFFFTRKSNNRLHTVENDRACFDAVIIADAPFTPSSESQKNIIDAKDTFTDALSELTLKNLLKLYELILNSKINRIELEKVIVLKACGGMIQDYERSGQQEDALSVLKAIFERT